MLASSLCVAFLLIALGDAQTQKVALDQTSFSLRSGMVARVQFRLDAPIICPTQTTECSVTVRITNMDTTSVAIDTCLVKWRSIEWSAVRTVTITAKSSFVDDAQKTIMLVTSAANSSSVYYSGFRPANITLTTTPRRPSQCSATGDPHYTTFDGYYWHFYDPVQNVLYRSTAQGRTFEIQARLWIPPYARHCGLAGREENDMVIIDQCADSVPRVTRRFSSPTALAPRVVVSGVTTEVFYRSGSYMRVDAYGWGMNVYVTAPGQDYNRTVGLCGNNNGRPGDDSPAYVIWHERDLFPDQRLGSRQDLWSWYPSSTSVSPTLPPYAEECSTLDVPYLNPVLSNPDGQDITNLLRNDPNPGPLTLAPVVIATTTTTSVPGTTAASITIEAATQICLTAINSSALARDCGPLFVRNGDITWLDRYVSGCAEDTSLLGVNPAWVAAAMQDMQSQCASLAAAFQLTLSSSFCPTTTSSPCSGNGRCVNNTCICNTPFSGSDCTIDTNSPPAITSLSASACDVKGIRPCPDGSIAVTGTNFLHSANLSCRFNNTIVRAMYMGNREIWCAFPRFTLAAAQENLLVSVSNNGVLWSNALPVTYYDSNCVLCDFANGCIPNPNSCTINGVCYADGTGDFNNPCLKCNRARSQFAWSYSYQHSICWPQFDFPIYSLKVVGQTPAGFALKTLSASNPLVAGDTSNQLTYSINGSYPNIPFQIQNDAQNPRLAVISTSTAVDVSSLDQARLPSTLNIFARDSFGNIAFATGIVQFVVQDTSPTFNATSYSGRLPENATIGTPLLTVVATPGSVSGPLTYDWVIADPHFSLNSTTGIIYLAQPLDFAENSFFLLQVRARDPTGQYQIVDVRVNVTYVPKPPTNIIVSNTAIDEKIPVNSVVGTLSSVDPGSSNWTYTVTPSNLFRIVNNQILTSVLFDFETGPRSIQFNLTTTDESGFSYTKTFTLTIRNVIEAPQNVRVCPLTGCTSQNILNIPDDMLVSELVGFINFTNPDHVPVTCQVYPNASFGVTFQDGLFKVFLRQALDYRVASTVYMFPVCTVVGSNGALMPSTDSQTVVNVINRPKAPAPVNLTLASNFVGGVPETQTNVVIGTVSSHNTDPTASTITFSVVSQNPAAFNLSTPSCQSQGAGLSCSVQVLLVGQLPDVTFNSSGFGSSTVTIRAVDSAFGNFVDTVVTIPVQFVNQPPLPPTWQGNNGFTEGSPSGTVVGVLQTNDVHDNIPQEVRLIGSTDFDVVLITNRRRAVGGSVYQVVLRNPSISFRNSQSMNLQLNITNRPPVGQPMSAIHTVSVTVSPRPWAASLHVGSRIISSSGVVNVIEKSTTGTVVGTLSLDGFDRSDELDVAYNLVSNGDGYFTVTNNVVAFSNKFLLRSAASTLSVIVNTTFTRRANAPRNLPFSPSTLSTFTFAVQAAPTFEFLSSAQSQVNVSVLAGSAIRVAPIAEFVVRNADNSRIQPIISNDPQGLFVVEYERSKFQVWLVRTPTVSGAYGVVNFDVVVNGAPVFGNMTVAITSLLFLGGGPNLFEEQKKGGMGSTSIAGLVVGAVIGAVIIALLVAIVVIRRRKEALKTAIANEPVYNTVGNPSLDNPNYLGIGGAIDGFESGLQNPMYAWYRPDLSREETEEFLVDQVEGAFVIRDSTATPGWHMLAVKTHNAIVHEKIKMSDEGLYELLPSSSRAQPRFGAIPELVEHYSRPQDGIRYALALDNPLYDNSQMAHRKAGHAVAGAWSYHFDPSAPSVPLKEREKAAVQQLVEGAGDEIYTNAEQAKEVLA